MNTYRRPSREERTRINRALDRWGTFEFFKDKSLMIQENDDGGSKAVCFVPGELEPFMRMQPPYLAGLVIGELKKQFVPSMAGADLFARSGKRNEFYIVVNENAEKLVLYGRDIMGESIVEASDMLDENELVIVLNRRLEAIGIGRTRFAGRSLLQKGRITVTTVADAGYYLREEG
ncbi:PUA domain-containing protein [Candidatus Nitrososphaera gargensis Ga9.2]|uniref:PUA domain-containing protein n=2 Tax=Candidatus Nitrososphaera gargensis TaxID=497727 RepID=K0IAI4_NITGG|nr:PUA domain-containing protein [Candidatus Nitrososphaera gargensis Ga9.2]